MRTRLRELGVKVNVQVFNKRLDTKSPLETTEEINQEHELRLEQINLIELREQDALK